jgi:hypothetical protein
LAGLVALASPAARAQSPGELKARMERRLGAVDALKQRGLAGENNRGFLEARGAANAADQKTVSDENADRRAVYVYLAGQTNSDPDTVGRVRAQKIAIASKRGVWVQDPNGEWRQKI